MAKQRDDVKGALMGKAPAQTWAMIVGMRAAMEHLWGALFCQVAIEAGLPTPELSTCTAHYERREDADVFAQRLKALVRDVEIQRFELGDSEYRRGPRHCVSVYLP